MAERKKVAYLTKPYEPITVIIEGTDGKRYETSLRVAILGITDTGNTEVKDGAKVPVFEFQAQMSAEVKPVTD